MSLLEIPSTIDAMPTPLGRAPHARTVASGTDATTQNGAYPQVQRDARGAGRPHASTPIDPTSPGFLACRQITAARARNFYLGLRLAPEPKRSALLALYAWMREADDLADADGPVHTAASRTRALEDFAARTHSILWQTNPVDAAPAPVRASWWDGFAAMVSAFSPPPSVFADTLEALRRDARAEVEPVDLATSEELAWYTDHVAGTVAIACVSIWGVRGRSGVATEADAARAGRLAVLRARAVQLTNILRDLREDLSADVGGGAPRSYLPRESYASHTLTPQDLLAWRDAERCEHFLAAWIAEARRLYAASSALESTIDPSCARVSWALAEVYRALLEAIAREPRRVVQGRVSVAKRRKATIALKGYLGVGLPG